MNNKFEVKKIIANGMVTVYVTDTGEKVVYGSELHEALEVKTPYKDWSERRFNDCDAIENEDYIVSLKNEQNPNGGRPAKEHIIKLDIAKEMAMLERNEKGKMVRRYFIQLEKRYMELRKLIALNKLDKKHDYPMYNCSLKIPNNTNWFIYNYDRINAVLNHFRWDYKDLWHIILSRASRVYDLDAAKKMYEQEEGHEPEYAMDIVNYFSELGIFADGILDSLMEEVYSTEHPFAGTELN